MNVCIYVYMYYIQVDDAEEIIRLCVYVRMHACISRLV
jgi:hypothetical protein